MIGEWIRFGLVAVFMVAGLFTMIVAILGLFRFDFALNRIHAAAMADTLSLLLFLVGVIIAVGFKPVTGKLLLVLCLQWLTSPLSSHMLSQFEYRVNKNIGACIDVTDAEFHEEVTDR